MNYFIIIAVAAILGFVQAQENDHDHKDHINLAEVECAKEKGVSLDVLKEAEKGKFPEDDKFNCFAECLFEKVGFTKPGSTDFDIEAMKLVAKGEGGDKSEAIVDKCIKEKAVGETMCDKTYNMYKCYFEEKNA